MTDASTELLYGRGDGGQLVQVADGMRLHRSVVEPLSALATAAAQASMTLRVCSGHRSFAQQLAIWNAKATGQRRLLDSDGRLLDASSLSPDALIDAILRWSALPGASRHHWGTDFDVFDAASVGPDYELQLTTAEAESRFGKLHAWLDDNMRDFGFHRPYASDLGGVAPEPWHLSYAPLSREYLAGMTVDGIAAALSSADMALKERVLQRLPELFERYVLGVTVA